MIAVQPLQNSSKRTLTISIGKDKGIQRGSIALLQSLTELNLAMNSVVCSHTPTNKTNND